MARKISVVMNTLNEAQNVQRAIESVKWADEVLVCDMHSEDETLEIAKKLGAKTVMHKRLPFVEPARNFAISEASGDWVLILDPDEEVPQTLAKELRKIASEDQVSFVEIPRKNIIFGSWVKESMWWPDYNIRFFKKGKVDWSDKIHRPPTTKGEGFKLPPDESNALNHFHYTSISQFLSRMNRYTDIQAKELNQEGYKFNWADLLVKPLNEFLSRYFANNGYKDGLHGLALSLLQATSFLVVYLKVWEMENFKEQEIPFQELKSISRKSGKEITYWLKYTNLSSNKVVNLAQRIKNRIVS